MVAYCADHPFFSYNDWFIGGFEMSAGIPAEHRSLVTTFPLRRPRQPAGRLRGAPGPDRLRPPRARTRNAGAARLPRVGPRDRPRERRPPRPRRDDHWLPLARRRRADPLRGAARPLRLRQGAGQRIRSLRPHRPSRDHGTRGLGARTRSGLPPLDDPRRRDPLPGRRHRHHARVPGGGRDRAHAAPGRKAPRRLQRHRGRTGDPRPLRRARSPGEPHLHDPRRRFQTLAAVPYAVHAGAGETGRPRPELRVELLSSRRGHRTYRRGGTGRARGLSARSGRRRGHGSGKSAGCSRWIDEGEKVESDEGRTVLWRAGSAAAGLLADDPETDDQHRFHAVAVAGHEVLRPLRPQGLRALSRIPGRGDQGVLPQLQRGDGQRLRAQQGRQQRGPRQRGHRGLDHHLRRHRDELEHRPAPHGGARTRRRRGNVSRQLQRRP